MEESTSKIFMHLETFQPPAVSAEQLKSNYYNCGRYVTQSLEAIHHARMYAVIGSDLDNFLHGIELQIGQLKFEDRDV